MSDEFFSQVDIDGIVEDHAKEVVGLQEEQARQIVDAYREVKRELQDRLSHVPAKSFTAQHLRVVLAQVDAAINSLNRKLEGRIDAGSTEASTMAVEQLIREIKRFDKKFKGVVRPINLDVVKVAVDTNEFLMNQYRDSLAKYGDDVKRDLARGLRSAVIEELPYDQVVHKLMQYFSGKEWEAHRIARTELHHIYGVAKLTGMKQLKADAVPDLKKGLYHPMDTRTGEDSIELAEMNPILPLNEPFRQTYRPKLKSGRLGKAQKYVFMTPPNRPNDRAILIPVRDEWL